MNSHVCKGNRMVRERRNLSEWHYWPVYMDSICSVSSRIGLSHTGCMGDAMGCQGIVPVVRYGPDAHTWGEKYLRNRHHANPIHNIPQRLVAILVMVCCCWRKALHKCIPQSDECQRQLFTVFQYCKLYVVLEMCYTKQLHDVWCEKIKKGKPLEWGNRNSLTCKDWRSDKIVTGNLQKTSYTFSVRDGIF